MREHSPVKSPLTVTETHLNKPRPFIPTPSPNASLGSEAALETTSAETTGDEAAYGHSLSRYSIYPIQAKMSAAGAGDPGAGRGGQTPADSFPGFTAPGLGSSDGRQEPIQRVPSSAAPPAPAPVRDFLRGFRDLEHSAAEGLGLESHADAQAAHLQAFLQHGVYGPSTLQPPTGIGGFDASYNPSSKGLLIEVKGGVQFQNGLTLTGGVIVANHTDLAQAATDGNTLPANKRAAFVRDFTWTPGKKASFITNLQSRVDSAWSGQHTFQCTRDGWGAVTATVAARVHIHEGANAAGDHLHVTPYRVPDGGTYSVGAAVTPHGGANNNDLVMSSNEVQRTPQSNALLRRQVLFDNDSAALTAASTTTLSQFIIDFQTNNVPRSNPVQLVGHASSTGSAAHNRALAQQRVDAVQAHLVSNGFSGVNSRVTTSNQGAHGATAGASSRRVDLIVGSGEGQLVAAHEFGHVFGLKDEYATNAGGGISGTGNPTGTIVGHDAMAKAIGAPGAIAENNDNIMSLGNTVRPQHYATFGWALGQITGVTEWQVS